MAARVFSESSARQNEGSPATRKQKIIAPGSRRGFAIRKTKLCRGLDNVQRGLRFDGARRPDCNPNQGGSKPGTAIVAILRRGYGLSHKARLGRAAYPLRDELRALTGFSGVFSNQGIRRPALPSECDISHLLAPSQRPHAGCLPWPEGPTERGFGLPLWAPRPQSPDS